MRDAIFDVAMLQTLETQPFVKRDGVILCAQANRGGVPVMVDLLKGRLHEDAPEPHPSDRALGDDAPDGGMFRIA
jgi:hypothetical protein